MTYASDLAAAYEAHGETFTVDGTAVDAFIEAGFAESLGISGTAISVRCISSQIAGAAVGDTVVRGAASYTIREVQTIGPDELETRLILEAV